MSETTREQDEARRLAELRECAGMRLPSIDTQYWVIETLVRQQAELAEAMRQLQWKENALLDKARLVVSKHNQAFDLRNQLTAAEHALAAAQARETGMAEVLEQVSHGLYEWDRTYLTCCFCGRSRWQPDSNVVKAEHPHAPACLAMRARAASLPDAGERHAERDALLEELVLLTARVGEWTSNRAPTNDELRSAIATMRRSLAATEGKEG